MPLEEEYNLPFVWLVRLESVDEFFADIFDDRLGKISMFRKTAKNIRLHLPLFQILQRRDGASY